MASPGPPEGQPPTGSLPGSTEGEGDLSTRPPDSQATRSIAEGPASRATSIGPPAAGKAAAPTRIGRYVVERVLGEGAFGKVFLARDEELHRPVAVKVIRQAPGATEQDVDGYLKEARVLASLDHRGILPVYDVGRQGSLCYIVSKLIAGQTLARLLETSRVSPNEAVAVAAQAAEALDYAHAKHVVHRDIKPANLLIDRQGNVFVSDFGLALTQAARREAGQIAGTVVYMSPEQARGDVGHMDGRSDVFSLGVVFYEMLTGRRPFRGRTVQETLEQILHAEPPLPSTAQGDLPRDLVRVCLRCLEKNPAHRFSALDLALALRAWQKTTQAPAGLDGAALRVVPERLRPFGADDADLYLELQYAHRGSETLPADLTAWKESIESGRAGASFRVGAVVGPAGCGKSSSVRAGLLPVLGEHVLPVCVTATFTNTEADLSVALRRLDPRAPAHPTLAAAVRELARRPSRPSPRKLLVVIDQFERWLAAHPAAAGSDLAKVLAACDGVRLQCLLLVREPLAPAAEQLLRNLGLPWQPGQNVLAVGGLDAAGAERVLIRIGQTWRCLPAELSPEAVAVVRQIVVDLGGPSGVSPVRLAQVAQAFHDRPWSLKSFSQMGGTRGALVAYCADRIGAWAGDGPDRKHRLSNVRAALECLSPPIVTTAANHVRPWGQAVEAAKLDGGEPEAAALLALLDDEMRLLTPAGPATRSRVGGAGACPYRMADDLAAEAARGWLARKVERRGTIKADAQASASKKAKLLRAADKGLGKEKPAAHFSADAILREADADDEERATRSPGPVWLVLAGYLGAGLTAAATTLLPTPILFALAVLAFLALIVLVGYWHHTGELAPRATVFAGLCLVFSVATVSWRFYEGMPVWRPSAAEGPIMAGSRNVALEGLPDLVQTLDDKDPAKRSQAALLIGRIGAEAKSAVSALTKRLSPEAEPEPQVRAPAAWALGELKDPAGLRPLWNSLADPDLGVRDHALEALRKLDLSAAGSAETVQFLVANLADPRPEARAQAAKSLGLIGATAREKASAPLTGLLDDSDLKVRDAAFAAAQAVDQPALVAAVDKLSAHLADERKDARLQAVRQLRTLGDSMKAPGASAALVRALDDADLEIRAEAFAALRAFDTSALAAAVPTLVARLRDPRPDVRLQAAGQLAALGAAARGKRTAGELLRALDDSDLGVRAAVFASLKAVDPDSLGRAVEKVAAHLADDPPGPGRVQAANQLGELGALAKVEQTQALLLRALDDRDLDLRLAAFEALRAVEPGYLASAVETLAGQLRDDRPEARALAVKFLGATLVAQPDAPLPPLMRLLADADPEARRSAYAVLEQVPRERLTSALPDITAILKDPNADSAALAARLIGRVGPPARDAVPVLVQALPSANAALARSAAGALAAIGPAAVPGLCAVLSESPSAPARILSAAALGEIGSPAALPALRDALRDVQAPIRLAGRAAIERFDPEKLGPAEVKMLVEHLQSDRSEDQLWAAKLAGAVGPRARDTVPELVRIIKGAPPGPLRYAVSQALIRIDEQEAGRVLRSLEPRPGP